METKAGVVSDPLGKPFSSEDIIFLLDFKWGGTDDMCERPSGSTRLESLMIYSASSTLGKKPWVGQVDQNILCVKIDLTSLLVKCKIANIAAIKASLFKNTLTFQMPLKVFLTLHIFVQVLFLQCVFNDPFLYIFVK